MKKKRRVNGGTVTFMQAQFADKIRKSLIELQWNTISLQQRCFDTFALLFSSCELRDVRGIFDKIHETKAKIRKDSK